MLENIPTKPDPQMTIIESTPEETKQEIESIDQVNQNEIIDKSLIDNSVLFQEQVKTPTVAQKVNVRYHYYMLSRFNERVYLFF